MYSFAKTLWIALTGQEQGFDGRFDHAIAEQNLRTYLNDQKHLHSLHALLRDCTGHDPKSRPAIREVHTRLEQWVRDEFHETATLEWKHMQALVLTRHLPARARWYETEQIAAVLSEALAINTNHCFYSSGGGQDFESCQVGKDPETLECFFGMTYIARPSFLELVSFASAPQWSYFWLQLQDLEQSGTREHSLNDTEFEYVTQLPDGSLLPDSCWDNDEYLQDGDWVRLPDGARHIARCLRGAWAIFGKASPYNQDHNTYDGRHATMGAEAFFQYILAHVKGEAKQGPGILRPSAGGPLPVDFVREPRK